MKHPLMKDTSTKLSLLQNAPNGNLQHCMFGASQRQYENISMDHSFHLNIFKTSGKLKPSNLYEEPYAWLKPYLENDSTRVNQR